MIQNILKPPNSKAFQDRAIATLLLNNQDKDHVRARALVYARSIYCSKILYTKKSIHLKI